MAQTKIITVIGTRPQYVKASAVSRAIKVNGTFAETIVDTGQHYDKNMSDIFLRELKIDSPKYNLGIGSGSHGFQTGRAIEAIEKILIEETPSIVLVYGDTNATLAGGLAASKLNIPVAHVEAGLRSYNRKMPEEINRVVTDHLSTWLFVPNENSKTNLIREGIAQSAIHKVGDVMYDTCLFFSEQTAQVSSILSKLGLSKKQFILTTIHRAENTDNVAILANILSAFRDISRQFKIVFPMHPRTRKAFESSGLYPELKSIDNLLLIEPLGYLDVTTLTKNARLVITDSGGMQKESYFFQTPCVTFRTETEWTELLDTGHNVLVNPSDTSSMEETVSKLINLDAMVNAELFGAGDAAGKIVEILSQKNRKVSE